MLHILLLILKIIGIILLVLLGLFLLLVCIVLLVPLRYRLDGKGNQTLDSLEGSICFSWLLHLVSGQILYKEQTLKWNVRIAFLKMNNLPEEDTSEASPDVRTEEEYSALERQLDEMPEPEKTSFPEKQQASIEQEPVREETLDAEKKELVTDPKASNVFLPEQEFQKEGNSNAWKKTDGESQEKEKKKPETKKMEENTEHSDKGAKIASALQGIEQKLKETWKKIKYTYDKICGNIESLSQKKELLEAFIENEIHQNAFRHVISELKHFLKILLPKKFNAYLHYGCEDPYHTGQILAGISMLYPLTNGNFSVEPDFDQRTLEGTLSIKGRIRVINFVLVGLRLLLDKNIRITIKDGKKLKVQL
ncbi:MAG: DUF2953 domain-containing protein [Hespellia sp.]|nr:DUF2953 domain-containing protein [Hespellia sp.]